MEKNASLREKGKMIETIEQTPERLKQWTSLLKETESRVPLRTLRNYHREGTLTLKGEEKRKATPGTTLDLEATRPESRAGPSTVVEKKKYDVLLLGHPCSEEGEGEELARLGFACDLRSLAGGC